MRNEMARVSHTAQSSCAGMAASLRSREGGAALALERESAQRTQLEQQLRERVGEMMTLQAKYDTERAELTSRSEPLCNRMLVEHKYSTATENRLNRRVTGCK